MDKNIAALIRDDTYTVSVRFYKEGPRKYEKDTILDLEAYSEMGEKKYTYVTDIPDILPGDHLVVLVGNTPKIVSVVDVHESCQIEPNETVQYKWVVAKVDYSHYQETIEKNESLTAVVSSAYKQNLKQQFRGLLMQGMNEEAQQKVLSILGGKNEAQRTS